ncbi:DUF2125 domain-containing protein [Phenylobacterium sp.]|jgi:hypothetical protein|uniref:DUF2125 domain-containing protein n=1 Tax=Phenylobacterium sp. TaxID=1871053 RepID=UPI002F408989
MSVPDPLPPRKPRRLGLYLPFVLLLAAAAVWSGVWFKARMELGRRLDAGAEALRKTGYDVAWGSRSIGGYPFRMDVTLTDARVRDPSGWALAAPRLEAEANMLSPGRWIMAAPQGVVFTRPVGGPVSVKGEIIRASLSGLEKTPPAFSFEGVKLAFQPAPGAQPFALTAADRVEFHLRPGPDDQGGVFLRVDGGKARLAGLFARVAGDRPVSLSWNSTLSKMGRFAGATWPEAVRAWSDAGGQISVRDAGLTAGDAVLGVQPGTLSVGPDGRIRGSLDLTLRQAPKAITALADTGAISPEAAQAAAVVAAARRDGETARATLTFQAGQTTFGPVAVAPAPRVY